jgi:YD repeat-containing protein
MKKIILLLCLSISVSSYAEIEKRLTIEKSEESNQLKLQVFKASSAVETKERLDSVVRVDNNDVPMSKQVFIYNEKQGQTGRINSLWDTGSSAWTMSETLIYEWDDDGYLLSEQYSYPSGGDNKYEYTYDSNGYLASRTFSVLDGSTWQYNSKAEYVNDSRGNLTNEVMFSYQGGNWREQAKTSAEYDDQNRRISLLGYDWNGSAWVGAVYQLFAFDEAGHNLLIEDRSWSGDTNDWVYWRKQEQAFENNNIILQSMSFWNEENKDWNGYPNGSSIARKNNKTEWTYDEQGRETLQEFSYLTADGWTLNVSEPTTYAAYTSLDAVTEAVKKTIWHLEGGHKKTYIRRYDSAINMKKIMTDGLKLG